MLLLLVLAGWIGVGFWWFTSHRDAPSDATGSFRVQLGTLERRSPGLVSPAHRLSRPAYAPRSRPAMRSSAHQRAATVRRRRDILVGLAFATGATFVLGLLPPLRMLLIATVVFGALLAAYVYLLVQIRDMEATRSYRSPIPAPPRPRRPQHPHAVAYAAPERAAWHGQRNADAYGYVYEAEPALVRRIAN